MNRKILFIAMLVFCLGMTVSAFAVNILPNPGFEDGIGSWSGSVRGAAVSVVTDPAVAHSGSNYASSIGALPSVAVGTFPAPAITIPISGAKLYKLSAWVQIPVGGAASTISLRYRWEPSANRVDVGGKSVAADGTWVKLESGWIAPAPADTTLGYFEVYRTAGAAATMYVDDCQLEESDYLTLTGRVVDSLGNGVDGALVNAKSSGYSVPSSTTSGGGYYTFAVAPGTYDVSAVSPGFKGATNVIVASSPTAASDIALAVNPDYVPGLLVDLKAKNLTIGTDLASWTNVGILGGTFDKFAGGVGPNVAMVAGKKAVEFVQADSSGPNRRTLASAILAPTSLSGNNPWTVSTDLFRTAMTWTSENAYFQWAGSDNGDATSAIFNYVNNQAYNHWGTGYSAPFGTVPGANGWHNVTVTFDGANETIYVDGVQNGTAVARTLNIKPSGLMLVGGRTWQNVRGEDQYWRFNGAIANLKVFDYALSAAQVTALTAVPKYTINASAGANGAISPSGALSINEGDSPTFVITPATGYGILDVLVDGVSNADAIAAGSYTFTNVVTGHTISATFTTLPTTVVTGKVTDGTVGIAGANVYFKTTANATQNAWVTTTTDVNGNYSQTLPIGNWFVGVIAQGYDISADIAITVAATPLAVADIVLVVNPNWDLLFSLNTDDFNSIADGARITTWNCAYPVGKSLPSYNTYNNELPLLGPAVEIIDGVKWEKNVYGLYSDANSTPPSIPTVHARADGFNAGIYTSDIPANGVTIVAVVKPKYVAIGGEARGEIVDIFYNELFLAVNHQTGEVIVMHRGVYTNTGYIIQDGIKTILSLVVKPNGDMTLYANGVQQWFLASGQDYSTLRRSWANTIAIGRNAYDGWSTFNGNIGDVYVYKNAISDTKREELQNALGTKFGITIPKFTTISGIATLADGVTPLEGVKVTCVGSLLTTATTGADGTYSVNVEAGTDVSITAIKDSFLLIDPIDGSYEISVGNDPVVNLNFKLTAINTVTGIVKDVSNKPIYNAIVQIGVGGPAAITGADGKFTIAGITPDMSASVYADALGYADNTQTVNTVPAGSGVLTLADIVLATKNETDASYVQNGDFESITGGKPTGWSAWPGPDSVIFSTSAAGEFFSGTYGAKITPTDWYQFLGQNIPVVAGSTYNCYWKMRADADTTHAFPFAEFRDAAGNDVAPFLYIGYNVTIPSVWTQYPTTDAERGLACRITIPAGAVTMSLIVGSEDGTAFAGKSIYVDDVVIDRVGDAYVPPVTGPTYGANNKSILTDGKLVGKNVKVWGKIISIDTGSYVISDGYSAGVKINGSTAQIVGDIAVIKGVVQSDKSITP